MKRKQYQRHLSKIWFSNRGFCIRPFDFAYYRFSAHNIASLLVMRLILEKLGLYKQIDKVLQVPYRFSKYQVAIFLAYMLKLLVGLIIADIKSAIRNAEIDKTKGKVVGDHKLRF